MSLEDNPLFRRAAKRGSTGHGNASEKKVGKSLAARMTPASGAMVGAKGDMQYGTLWKGEAKATIHDTMRVEYGWLNKITVEALNAGRTPFLTVSFVNGDGSPKRAGQWVMVPLETFKELTGGGDVS